MKKRMLSILFVALVLFTVNAFAAYSGTPAEPKLEDGCYQIGTAEELYGFAAIVNGTDGFEGDRMNSKACGVLTADIVVNENVLKEDGSVNRDGRELVAWTRIGIWDGASFGGSFDGMGHTISGLYFNENCSIGAGDCSQYVGLFGYVKNLDQVVSISNVGVKDSYFYGYNYVGGLVGYAQTSLEISNSYNTSTIAAERGAVGGLVGLSYSSLTISNSFNQGIVLSTRRAGGLVGCAGRNTPNINNYSIVNSYNAGITEGSDYDDDFIGESINAVSLSIVNSFYVGSSRFGGEKATDEQFKNGSVAIALRNGGNGSVWGQIVGIEEYPSISVKGDGVVKYSVTLGKDVDGCYLIGTAEELYAFADIVNGGDGKACGKLTADIVMNGSETTTLMSMLNDDGTIKDMSVRKWIPIGSEENPFRGTFDGQGHAISGLYFNEPNANNAGLFGYVGYKNKDLDVNGDADKIITISNVGVKDSYIQGRAFVGTLVGSNENSYLTISNSYSISSVLGIDYVGGLVGYVYSSTNSSLTISNSYSASAVTSTSYRAGGLVGSVASSLNISNSFNQGHVKASDYVGGFVGNANGAISITNSYNVGSIEHSYDDYDDIVVLDKGNQNKITIANTFFTGSSNRGGEKVTSDLFKDGSVAILLHDWCEKEGDTCKESGLNGNVWGQNVGEEDYPILNPNGDGIVRYSMPYKVSLMLNGGSVESGEDFVTHTPGVQTTLPIPSREGYIFVGWYDNKNFTGDVAIEIAATENGVKTYYAKWIVLHTDEDGCYLISDAKELYRFADIVNGTNGLTSEAHACGKLTQDIVVNENVLKDDGALNGDGSNFVAWTPIGTYIKDPSQGYPQMPFKGTFDGQGHSISGLYFNEKCEGENCRSSYIGLFGIVSGETVTIKNVGVKDSYIHGKDYVGGLVGGSTSNLTISNSYSNSTVIGSALCVGGLVGGTRSNLTISNSYSNSTVTGGFYVGGLVGSGVYSLPLIISNSFNLGHVKATGDYAGGFATGVGTSSSITNSYNVGLVESTADIADDFVAVGESNLTVANSYYIDTEGHSSNVKNVKTVDPAEFSNGSVAILLHDWCEKEVVGETCKDGGLNGKVWGQKVGTDPYPALDGKILFALDLNLNGGVLADGDFVETYEYGKKTVLPTPTREGYAMKGWFEIAKCAENPSGVDCVAVTEIAAEEIGAKSFHAGWAKLYTITFVDEDGKTILKDAAEYEYGTPAADIVPDENPVKAADAQFSYTFAGWDPEIADVTADATYKAFYRTTVNKYTITLKVSDSEMGSVTGAGTYEYGTEVELVASAAEGYKFSNWEDDVVAAATRKVVVKADAEYTANFEKLASSSSNSSSSSNDMAGSSSSEKTNSSSSEKEDKSSSSGNTVAKSSSSKTDGKSSSSSAKSSSSTRTDAIVAAVQTPQLNVAVIGRSMRIAGARVGSAYAVFDMHGRVLATGRTTSANFALTLSNAGSYMVRVGGQVHHVNVK